MADFALWATACGRALWPAGAFARAYDANRRAAVQGIIEADPVALCARKLMAERSSWVGTASDLLNVATNLAGDDVSKKSAGWPKHPGALAGRLRRAQTFLRLLGIEIAFSRTPRMRIPPSPSNEPNPWRAVSANSDTCRLKTQRWHDFMAKPQYLGTCNG
jgi:hypothetical protein